MGDAGTGEYFERHCHDYDPKRLTTATAWVGEVTGDDPSLFDVGCGTGGTLEVMRDAGVRRLAGCDVARAALTAAATRVDFDAHLGSILDDRFVAGLPGGHDVVLMSAVLHHVVGGTRRSSRRLAGVALQNGLRLTAPGGVLLIVEPTYRPRWAMTLLFWVKRLLGSLTGGRRLELGRWNNLGAPLVSYYSPAEIQSMIEAVGGTVLRCRDEARPLRRLPRLLGISHHWITTIMVRSSDEP